MPSHPPAARLPMPSHPPAARPAAGQREPGTLPGPSSRYRSARHPAFRQAACRRAGVAPGQCRRPLLYSN